MQYRHAVGLGILCLQLGWSQGIIGTYAGRDRTFTFDGQPATSFFLGKISSVALDSSGNPVIAVPFRNVVLRINPDGTVTRLAGSGNPGFSADGLKAVNATLHSPQGVTFDSASNLYIADNLNNRVARISSDGTITTFAGTGAAGFGGDQQAATQALLNGPIAVAVDGQNNVYISDEANRLIRKVAPTGIITTYAGNGSSTPFQNNVAATATSLIDPVGIALDSNGNLYIADAGANRVLKVDAKTALVTNIAGTGQAGTPSEGAVAATSTLRSPAGVFVDASNNIYIADTGNFQIRKVGSDGTIRTVAGSGGFVFGGDGGPALSATFQTPFGLAMDSKSNLYIADRDHFRVRKVDANQQISTIAGNGTAFDNGVAATSLLLAQPTGVAIAQDGSLLIADAGSDVVRRVRTDGVAFTVAGTGAHAFYGDGGPASSAQLSVPFGVAFDAAGNLYIADNLNQSVRKVDANGVINTVAGNLSAGFGGDNGQATQASLFQPSGVAFDSAGNLYIADSANNRIRRVAGNVITTVVGTGRAEYNGDSISATTASLFRPLDLAFDASGNMIIADTFNKRVRKVSPNGTITTIAGGGQVLGAAADGGQATAASLGLVGGVAADATGNVYFSDFSNNTVRKIGAGGILSTVAGNGKAGFAGDGGPATQAMLNFPNQLAIDKAGNLFVADGNNDRIRVIYAAPPSFQSDTSLLTFTGFAGGVPTDSQTVNLTSPLAGLPFTVSASPAANWLTITPPSGQMPAKLTATADPSQLPAGVIETDIVVSAPSAAPPTQNIHVRFNVAAAQAAKVSPDTTQLNFAFARQAAASTRTVQVRNGGSGTLAFDTAVSNGGSWLKISAPSGTAKPGAPFSLGVTADPTGLDPGTYIGAVNLSNHAGTDTASIGVTVTVSSTPQTMLLSQTGLTFTAVQGITDPVVQTFEVLNTGQGTMNWSLTSQTLGNTPGWLSVNPASGSSTSGATPSPISVQVNTNGLTVGTYYGSISVTSPTAVNSPQMVTVVLNVLKPDQIPPAVVQPGGLIFTGVAKTANPPSQTITISNLSATPLTLGSSRTFVGTGNFFVHDPINATIAPGSAQTITVTPIIAGLLPGVYQGALSLAFSDGTAQAVLIRLILAPSGTTASPDGLPTTAAICGPTKLVPLFTTFTGGFSVPAAWPEAVTVRVSDDCGFPVTTGNVIVSFSNGDPPLRLNSLNDGRWSQSWTPVRTAASVVLTADAQSSALTGTTTLNGGLQDNPDPPLVTPEGILSAANSSAGAPLSLGSLITLYGVKLADGVAQAQSLPLETSLQGVSVVLAGRKLPLQYTGSGQINAIVPYDVPSNGVQALVVLRGNKQSAVVQIPMADTLPAVFTRDGSGSGQGDVLDASNVFYDASHPAHAGDVAVIYCTGLGPVTGVVPAGSASPADPLASTVNPVTVSIGGVTVKPFFSGLTPGSAGLYQINLILPSGITPGNAVPVVVTAGNRSSATVTMAVQ